MPTRILREGIVTSEAVNSLSDRGEIFFRRLMSVLDDYGRYYSNPALLRAACFPLKLDKVSEADVKQMLSECVSAGLVVLYNGGKHLQMLNFRQQTRAASKFPEPSDCELLINCKSNEKQMRSESESESESESVTAKTNNNGRRLPTLAEVITHGEFVGIPKETCEDFFHHFEAMGWVDKNGNPIMKWDSKLRGWKVKAQEANQVAKNGANLGSDTFWKDKARLDILEKELAAIDARASHTAMEVHIQPQDRERHGRLKMERRELKTKMKLL